MMSTVCLERYYGLKVGDVTTIPGTVTSYRIVQRVTSMKDTMETYEVERVGTKERHPLLISRDDPLHIRAMIMCKPTPIPFPMRASMEKELERLRATRKPFLDEMARYAKEIKALNDKINDTRKRMRETLQETSNLDDDLLFRERPPPSVEEDC
jgi:hypothetical protein